MNFAEFLEQTFEGGKIDVDRLHSVMKMISKKLSFDELQVENLGDLKEKLNAVNLSKRVEAVEDVTKNIFSSLGKLKQTDSCLNQKLEETRIFLNKLQDQLDDHLHQNSEITRTSDDKKNENVNINNLTIDVDEKLENHAKSIESLKFSQNVLNEKFEKMTGTFCEMKQQNHELKENIEDLFFTFETFENKIDEIEGEIKEFNARINCVKCEVFKTVNNMKCLNEKIPKFDKKFETLSCEMEKENLKKKSFEEEMMKFMKKDDIDTLDEKISSLSAELEKFKINTNIYFLRLQNQMRGKMNSDELLLFKEIVESNFRNFVKELELLIKGLVLDLNKGVAGKFLDLNCIACDSQIAMKNESHEVPKLKILSNRFLMKTDKFQMKNYQKNSKFDDVYELFRPDTCDDSSKKCFIISKDQSIFKADPEKCENNSRYQK